jgi:succinate dehydrogenase / fumarate reductase flavoprotein subunit
MGNSLLDVCVFGRRAGTTGGQQFAAVKLGKLTLAHVGTWEKQLAAAGIETAVESPLVLPDYARHGR